mgnify:CR=1 FL=1
MDLILRVLVHWKCDYVLPFSDTRNIFIRRASKRLKWYRKSARQMKSHRQCPFWNDEKIACFLPRSSKTWRHFQQFVSAHLTTWDARDEPIYKALKVFFVFIVIKIWVSLSKVYFNHGERYSEALLMFSITTRPNYPMYGVQAV